MATAMATDNVQVAVRCRPLITREVKEQARIHWKIDNNSIFQVDTDGDKVSDNFIFDYIFDTPVDNETVFNQLVKQYMTSFLNGFNVTIFTYGATSSGKTYTMFGNKNVNGIIQLSIDDIFKKVFEEKEKRCVFRTSYIEIYNESCRDLFGNNYKVVISGDKEGINIKAKEIIVTKAEEVLALMKKGESNRHFGVTNMNERSSRSHTIFRIIAEISESSSEDAPVKISVLNLVDLAGSERLAQSGATGVRFTESTFINKSLSALSNVIRQVVEGQKHVNYRDSKLTRILQDSIGGNARTLIIANITPASLLETHSTLQFAKSAKMVTNQPHLNEILKPHQLLTKEYKLKIAKLMRKIEEEQLKCSTLEEHLKKEQETFISKLQKKVARKSGIFLCHEQEMSISRRHTFGGYLPSTIQYAPSQAISEAPYNIDLPVPKKQLSSDEDLSLLSIDTKDEDYSFAPEGSIRDTENKLLRDENDRLQNQISQIMLKNKSLEKDLIESNNTYTKHIKMLEKNIEAEQQKSANDLVAKNEIIQRLQHEIKALVNKFQPAREGDHQPKEDNRDLNKYIQQTIWNQIEGVLKVEEAELPAKFDLLKEDVELVYTKLQSLETLLVNNTSIALIDKTTELMERSSVLEKVTVIENIIQDHFRKIREIKQNSMIKLLEEDLNNITTDTSDIDTLNNTIDQLKKTNDEIKTENNKISAENTEMKDHIYHLQDHIFKLNSKMKSIEVAFSVLGKENTDFKKHNDELQYDKVTMLSKIDYSDTVLKNLRDHIAHLTNENDTINEKVTILEKNIEKLKADKYDLECDNKSLYIQLTELDDINRRQERYMSQVTQTDEKFTGLQEDKNKADEKIKEQEKMICKLEKEKEDYLNLCSHKGKEIRILKTRVDGLYIEQQQDRATIGNLESEMAILRAELVRINIINSDMNDKYKRLERTYSVTSVETFNQKKKLIDMQEKIWALEKEAPNIPETLNAYKLNVDVLEKKLERSKAKHSVEVKKLEEELKELQDIKKQYESLQKEFALMQNKYENTKKVCRLRREEIEELNVRLQILQTNKEK